jgi:hypothetical protein
MDDAMQFVCVEPGAVRSADIDDDPGAVREIQAMLASRAPQCSQFGASPKTAAPQLWQLSVFAFMAAQAWHKVSKVSILNDSLVLA